MNIKPFKITRSVVIVILGLLSGAIGFLYSTGYINIPATAQDLKIVRNLSQANRVLVDAATAQLRVLQTNAAVEKYARANIKLRLGRIEKAQAEMLSILIKQYGR